MRSETTIKLLAATCLVEFVAVLYLVGTRPLPARAPVPAHALPEARVQPGTLSSGTAASVPLDRNSTPAELVQQNTALETKLAEVSKELNERKSEISFSYGSLRDSGRFVGMTFRKMFETAAAREATEAQARMADNQINVLSLGPFIQDAEVMESDPQAFAQFQTPLLSEVLGLPPERSAEVESLLGDLKARALKVEEGSPEWAQLNDTALQRITAMLPESQRLALKPQLDFLQQYGVLVIPAYSILKAPTPTVAAPVVQ